MTRVKLTDLQKMALEKFADGQTRTAYSSQCSLGTLNALKRKECLVSRGGLGAMAFPHTSISWTITEVGRAALSQASERQP